MANRVFQTDLSVKGLNQLKKDLRTYQRKTLPGLVERFVNELAEVGIRVAKINAGEYGAYIGFEKRIVPTKYNYQCKAILMGYNAIPNVAIWVTYGDFTQAEVNSIMMAEFGSGPGALPGYRGTFPDQTHAFEDYWRYATEMDANGNPQNWHTSHGIKATRPMYKAQVTMKHDIELVARRVFG